MNANPFFLNLTAAWLGLLLGFLSGMGLGLFFHRDNWLGGYGSLKRRMYRLGHISFFGLGAANFIFYFTTQGFATLPPNLEIASIAFLIGAGTMPVCCVIMAHWPKAHLIFCVPVVSLLLGATLTVLTLFTQLPQPILPSTL